MYLLLSWNSPCRPGWPQTLRDPPALLGLKASAITRPPSVSLLLAVTQYLAEQPEGGEIYFAHSFKGFRLSLCGRGEGRASHCGLQEAE